jgi:hypothetical protein
MFPLQWLEALFRLLLPPASREHVLGDLHERCKSPQQYLMEAASVLGPVVISRVRRTTDLQVFFIEVIAVYLSFSTSAWWLGQRTFLYDRSGFIRLAIPTVITCVGLLVCNAYADPEKPSSSIQPIIQSAGCTALAFLGQAVLFDTHPKFAVPFGTMLCGSCISFVLLSLLRMFFPPLFRNTPKAVFLKEFSSREPDFTTAQMPFQQILQRITEAQSPLKLKIAGACAVVLVTAMLLLSPARHGAVLSPHFMVLAIAVLLVGYLICTRE